MNNEDINTKGGKHLRTIRWLFILIFPFLIAQFLFAVYVEEPYPAFILPLYGGVFGQEGVIENTQQRIFLYFPDDTIQFTKQELFADLPEPHRIYAVDQMFGLYSDTSIRQDEGFIEWLEGELIEISGREDFEQIEVEWFIARYYIEEEPVRYEEEAMGSTVLNL